jgi:CheY-like chemotaxis protein
VDAKTTEVLKDRSILIIGSAEVSRELAAIFQPTGSKLEHVATYVEAHGVLKSGSKIELLILEANDPVETSYRFIRELRASGLEVPPLFLITDKLAPKLQNAYYEGFEAVFLKPLAPDEVLTGIAFSYDAIRGHANRKHSRKQIQRVRIAFTLDSTEFQGYATNISLGGMFVGTFDDQPAQLPLSGVLFKFKLMFEDKGNDSVFGIASARWLRQKIELGRPRGFGAQFVGLDARSRLALEELLGPQ